MNKKDGKNPYKYNMLKLLSVSILLVSVTFCWFIFTKNTSIDSISLEVTGVVNVTITNHLKEDWDNKVEIDESTSKNTITEYSGNGKRLYMPIISKKEVIGYFLDDKSLSNNSEETGYIEIVTYVKTDGPISLYLSPDSSITPYNKNKLEDNIAGAVRVAVLAEGMDPFIWVPNTTYQYDEQTGKVNKNGTPEKEYLYVYSEDHNNVVKEELTYEQKKLSTSFVETIKNDNLAAFGVSENKRFVWGNLNEFDDYTNSVDPIIVTDNELYEEKEFEMVIRIWIEGTDREAVKTLIGGKFNINLTFIAVDNK